MNWLIKLYPRGWRDRYGDEFAALLADVSGPKLRPRTVWDIARGAFDAHLKGRYGMTRFVTDPAVRRGLLDGLVVSGLIAVLVVVTNVVFPGGPEESDDDPEYMFQYVITLGVLAVLLTLIGARGTRRAGGRSDSLAGVRAGVKAGASAGAVIAAMVTLTFLAVNNLFLDIVSRQHDKRVAFASSGWTSMRAYLTVTQLQGALVLIPVLALIGAMLGLLGAEIVRTRGGRAAQRP